MDLELTDEQSFLAESVQQLLASSPGAAAWPALVEFGVLSIASGEAEDVGAVELALIARALGERLESVPLIDTAAALYASRSDPAFAGALADRAIALALLEPGGGWELDPLTTSLAIGGLDGQKVATGADAADALLVVADDGVGPRLAVVAADAAGVSIAPAPGIDASLQPASVTLAGVAVDDGAVLPLDATEAVLERLKAIGAVLAAAEAAGAAASVLELARQYATERRQFGRPIGSFQALRHLLADMYVKQDSSWSTVLFAAAALDDGAESALRTASIAKAYVSRAARLEVAQDALQVFGGIAFTDEHGAHRFLRRIIARGQQFGDARHHERAIGRALVGARQATGSRGLTLLDSLDLTGRAAVVAGGHGDLAESIAGVLAEMGCGVVLAARKLEACDALAHRLEAAHGVRTLALAADVSREADVERVMSTALEEFGAIDVLVNSAATFWSGLAEDIPVDRGWRRVIEVNLTGTFLACQAAGRAMLAAGGGSIINIAATGGLKSFMPEMGPNLSYMVSKGAVIKLTRDLAVQWALRGVRVNAIAPGSIAGGMMQSLPADKLAPMVAQIPMRRQGRPDELRGAVAYLASEASSYVTGTVLVVDGGQSIV